MKTLGVDFGTSTSEVAVCDEGRHHLLRDPNGDEVVSTIVAFLPTGDELVGNRAKVRNLIDPTNTIHSFKRIIGLSGQAREVREFEGMYAFNLVRDPLGRPCFVTRAGELTAEQVAVRFFAHLASYPGIDWRSVGRTVTTVPASFSAQQTEAIVRAAEVGGMRHVKVVDEAHAVALAYLEPGSPPRNLLVYDLGGGTFDVAVVRTRGLDSQTLARGGDGYLGGNDIDHSLACSLVDEVLRTFRFDLSSEGASFNKLVLACEKAKIDLSRSRETRIELGQVHPAMLGSVVTVTRDTLGRCIFDLTRRTFVIIDEVLDRAKLTAAQIDSVVLAGGCSNIPSLRAALSGYFGRAPLAKHDPNRVVAIGASRVGALGAG